jgi:hypothetical protein
VGPESSRVARMSGATCGITAERERERERERETKTI